MVAGTQLDIAKVRGSFPALAGEQVFFDNAGGSQTLGTVIDSIRDYLTNTNVQLGASYATGVKSTTKYDEGYKAAAKYINASADDIVLGSSTTQLFRNVSYALHFGEGDEIVVSKLDHEANIAPWVALAERQGLLLKWWSPPAGTSPRLDAEGLGPLLSDRTRLVTLTHASNILGTIHDVRAISAAVRARCPAALVCVDAVAYAPHRRVDVGDLGVDLYAFSWYKVYGPHISMLYASGRAKAQLRSLGHYFNSHDTLEDKLGLAGASYELVAAIPAVVSYLDGQSTAAIEAHEARLSETLLRYLNGRTDGDVTVYGEKTADSAVRVPTIAFTVKGWSSRDLVEALEKVTNFGFRWGNFYSVRLVQEFLGLPSSDGVVRVSMVHYNTVDEIDTFVKALDEILSSRP
ncbi:cysteine desulfurase [Gaeumannomyces tritici R3-111a-1]|uniref:Cysteine desulfurase n=1 Tax=Gaeumannomyces tritici (strain R3-111a-1) TaxID=644352 RepID=J3NL32_GAET3|nr:cysteine desulfurase [Gaeumannomyces tritici R3-111a-1]EJT81999.1 cysteine desulfurase [Gaeumannomyces tritici R3-111a-1]